jgi:hypothetical protein
VNENGPQRTTREIHERARAENASRRAALQQAARAARAGRLPHDEPMRAMTITMARQIRRQRWVVAAVGLSGLLAVSGAALQGHRLLDRAIPVVLLVLVVVCVAVILRQAGAAQRVLDQAAEQDHR